ncbi:hypothetical protein ACFSTE_13440 [Aquimarina hainanensis]|uniref:Type IV pilus biogenesis n=1 Tax=Aquimarina hainanensis TaxID=1578017 RepID=A0ABW5N8P5_9FLAO|nr:hypothetical protein [Aquimarina sp. TRL1]QKX04195.1 hypothetical protein HN014_04485 [Aquimarina sp. TRL1]
MKKKRINIFLGIVLLVIWGLVGTKLLRSFFTEKEVVITSEALVTPTVRIERIKDTFSLDIQDRDPFLGKIKTRKKRAPKKKAPSYTGIPKVKQVTQWPAITYLGFVKSSGHKYRLGLLRVDGVLKRVREGGVIKGVQVLKVEKEQLVVRLGKELRKIKK